MDRHIWLDPKLFGTHSLRRTEATLIYRRTGNLRAVQLLFGHTKIESTVRYLGRSNKHKKKDRLSAVLDLRVAPVEMPGLRFSGF
jgi:integrase